MATCPFGVAWNVRNQSSRDETALLQTQPLLFLFSTLASASLDSILPSRIAPGWLISTALARGTYNYRVVLLLAARTPQATKGSWLARYPSLAFNTGSTDPQLWI